MKKIVTIIVSFAFILAAMCTGVSAMEIPYGTLTLEQQAILCHLEIFMTSVRRLKEKV